MLGSTYDPRLLWSRGVVGMVGNRERARQWYSRARELGYPDAKKRADGTRKRGRRVRSVSPVPTVRSDALAAISTSYARRMFSQVAISASAAYRGSLKYAKRAFGRSA
jgi:hypothetical protein